MQLIKILSLVVMSILLLMELTKRQLSIPIEQTNRKYHYSYVLIILFWASLVYVSGFRKGFVDTVTYRQLYDSIETNYSFALTDEMELETGFKLFMIFLKRIWPDSQFFVFITSLIILSIEIWQISKYSSDTVFSLAIYFLLSFMGTMNGIRQCMAAAILFLAFDWVIERKTLPYILLVLLVSTLHTSALVCIPLYFIISGKRNNIGILLFGIMIVAMFLFPNAFDSVLSWILKDSTYEEYVDNQERMGIVRLAVAAVPVAVSLLYCRIQHKNNRTTSRLTDVLINMQFVSFGFTAMGLHMLYYARLSMYVGYATILLLPTTLKGCFTSRSFKVVKVITLLLYTAFFVYQIYAYNKYGYMSSFYLVR